MKQATRISLLTGTAALGVVAGFSVSSLAGPSKSAKTRSAPKNRQATAPRKRTPLPRYVSLGTINTLRALRGEIPPALSPLLGGKPLPPSMKTMPGADIVGQKAGVRLVQLPGPAFPRPVPPARVRRNARAARPIVPRWVRYPLEFQLCGITLGTRVVDKDRFNRIDRYGLFAMHGNPTAVVVPIASAATGGGGPEGGGPSGPGGGPGGAMGAMGGGMGSSGGGRGGSMGAMGGPSMGGGGPEGGPEAGAGGAGGSITVQQTPPVIGYNTLFPSVQNGGLPDWASAITVQLDNNHVQWLYNRDTYAMGFVVDRLGYVDAIVVAGIESPIARTQLEDPAHTVKLGDSFAHKVLFRYGYPDTIETYPINVAAGVTAGGAAPTIGSQAGGSGPGGAAGAPGIEGGGPEVGGGGGGAGGGAGNNAFRTFEVRYEQSYNIVFTIRNNRVARIYIFGDPDFFNDRRRQQFRTAY